MANKHVFSPERLWAIERGWLDSIHILGEESLTAGQIESLAAGMKGLEQPRLGYELQDGVALVQVSGPTVKRHSLWSWLMGATSLGDIRLAMTAALNDAKARALVLAIDSPGGTVDGTMELAAWIRSHRGNKPMLGYADGMCCSAALWWGSQLDGLYGSGASRVGSISVLAVHHDYSNMDSRMGVKRSYLSTGKYKALGNDAEPLSDEARKYLLGTMQGLHDLFVNDLSRGLGMELETVAELADGRVYLAAEAVAKGLLTAEKNLEETMAAALDAAQSNNRKTQGTSMNENMTSKNLQEQYPEAAGQLIEQGRAQGAQEAAAAQVQAEQQRMIGLVALVAGQEAADKLAALAASGISAEQARALAAAGLTGSAQNTLREDSAAEQAMKLQLLEGLQQSGQQNPGHGGTGAKNFLALVEQYATEKNISKVEAMKAVSQAHPELHRAYIDHANNHDHAA